MCVENFDSLSGSHQHWQTHIACRLFCHWYGCAVPWMGDIDTWMSPGLCFLAWLSLSTHSPQGDSQPQPLTPPLCIERANKASQSFQAIFTPLSLAVLPPPSSSEIYKMTGQINCKKYFGNFGISACGPQGCSTKDWRPYCCCVPLWWQPIAWQRCDNRPFQI